ncbi:MAG: DUF1657 domain-containing protein [Firmicutes bacterium]|nr:DUF1657 domain-containing protein [Bacillota bacterium]
MTIGSQVKQTLTSLKGAKATLTIYRNQEQNRDSQVLLTSAVEDLNKIINELEGRVKILEFEEPSYKGQ